MIEKVRGGKARFQSLLKLIKRATIFLACLKKCIYCSIEKKVSKLEMINWSNSITRLVLRFNRNCSFDSFPDKFFVALEQSYKLKLEFLKYRFTFTLFDDALSQSRYMVTERYFIYYKLRSTLKYSFSIHIFYRIVPRLPLPRF